MRAIIILSTCQVVVIRIDRWRKLGFDQNVISKRGKLGFKLKNIYIMERLGDRSIMKETDRREKLNKLLINTMIKSQKTAQE